MHWWKFGVGLSIVISILIAPNAEQPKYEGAMVDIVLLLDESASMDEVEHQKMLNVMSKLPSIFPIGPKKSHVATVVFATRAVVKHNFTDNVTVFNDFISNAARTRQLGDTYTANGLALIHDVVLASDQRPDVANVIIIFTDGCTWEREPTPTAMNKAVEQANKLLARGCLIFLVHLGKNDECENRLPSKPMPHQLHLVGNVSTRRFQYDNFDNLTEDIFKQVGEELGLKPLCNATEVCYYADDDKKTCVGRWEQSNATGCIAQVGDADCNIDKCEISCKNRWLDENGACSKWCSKPASEPCKICFRCRIKSTTSTTAASAEAAPNQAKNQDKDKVDGGKSDSDSRSQWIYVGVAIGVGLLLVMLLVFAFVVVRKRRQRRKHAALMRKKGDVEGGPDPSISKSKSKSKSESKSGSRKPSTKHESKSLPSIEPTTSPFRSKVTSRASAVHQNEKPPTQLFRPTSNAMRMTLSTEPKKDESKKQRRRS